MTYERKIDFAIKLLRNIPQDGPIEISYSGGKDSDVILRLAQMAGIPHEAIYKQTTDPPGTTAHAKAMGATILRPKLTFFELIEKKGIPSRFARFCCEELKEYKVYDRAVQGIRREESTKRADRYKEPELCRKYGKDKVRVYLPILEWSLEDVARFIDEQKIRCAPVYYDEAGNFCPSRRLGCIGCPLATGWKRREQFKQYPGLLRQWIISAKKYYESKPEALEHFFDGDIYEKFYCDLFFEKFNKYSIAQISKFRKVIWGISNLQKRRFYITSFEPRDYRVVFIGYPKP